MVSKDVRTILWGVAILTLGTALSMAWYTVYQQGLVAVVGEDTAKDPWFNVIAALTLTGIVIGLVVYLPWLKPEHIGVPKVC